MGAPLDALVPADRAYAELLTLVEQSGGEPRSDALRSKERLSVLAARCSTTGVASALGDLHTRELSRARALELALVAVAPSQTLKSQELVDDTDWGQVVALYDQLSRIDPSPIVALNRAVAVARRDGPDGALTLVDGLPLSGYHAWHAVRADLLRRLGRSAEAKEAYAAAIAITENTAERAYLRRKRGELVRCTG